MKFTVILTMVCALLFTSFEIARADEISDLKKQLELLQKKIEDLEKKQAEQAKSVEKIEKQPSAREVVSEALSKQVTLGGHLKFFLADQSIGEVSNATLNKDKQHDSFAAGISSLWIYFNKQLNDWLSISVAPQLLVEAAATPVLGSDITRSGSANVDVELDWAYLTARLPWELELKAGAFYPYFSEEYASMIWWDEQYNGNPGLLTLESWKSAGLELYRNFDFDNFSLPVYLYYLNGEDRGVIQDDRYTDNNSAKNILAHIAPEFFAYGARVKLLGSFGWGKWDDEGDNQSIEWAAGADVKYRSFGLSGEYMNRRRDDLPLLNGVGTEDGEDKGWYVKGIYTFNPQWRLVLKYSDVDLWSPGTDSLLTDNFKTMYGSINYFITNSSIIIPEISYVKMDRSGSPDRTDYWRYTLGWRTTF